LLSETGDMLMTAKWLRRESRVDFFLAAEGTSGTPKSPASPSKKPKPAFSMTHSENNDNWVLKQMSCKHCIQRPKHLTCEALGKAQQIAFIQHARKKVGKALVHYVDTRIPALVDDLESMVWCPVTEGRDLCEKRSPAHNERTPEQRRRFGHTRTPSNNTPSNTPSGTPKEAIRRPQGDSEEDQDPLCFASKLPTWDESLKHLIMNFGDRTPKSSPMNFMIVNKATEEDEQLVMLHAKLSANTYCLDFKHPLSTVQAFGIALTALPWD